MLIRKPFLLLLFFCFSIKVSSQTSLTKDSDYFEDIADSIITVWKKLHDYESIKLHSVSFDSLINANINSGPLIKALEEKVSAIDDGETKIRILILLSNSQRRHGKFNEAYNYINVAIEAAKRTDNQRLLLHLYRAKSEVLYKDLKIKDHKALSLLLDAQEILKQFNDKPGEIYILKNIADYHYNMGDEDRAISLYKEVINKGPSLVDDMAVIDSWNAIGLIHRRNKEYDSALWFFDKALSIAKDKNRYVWIDLLNGNIGDTYHLMGDYTKAIPLLKIDLESSIKNSINDNIAKVYMTLGEAYLKTGQLDKAKESIESAIISSEKYKQYLLLSDSYKILGDFFEYTNNPSDALNSYRKSINIKDSINSIEAKKATNKIEIDRIYDLRDRQKKEAELEKQNAEQQIVIEKQKLWNLAIWMVIVFFIFLTISLYIITKKRKRVNAKLNEQYGIILAQKAEIEEFNANLENIVASRTQELNNINAELKQYAFINAHNIRGPLASILGLFTLLENQMHSKEEEQYIMNQIHESAKKMDSKISTINRKLEELSKASING